MRRRRDGDHVVMRCHPGARHRALGVDGSSGASTGCEELIRQGCRLDVSDVMTATTVREPPHPHRRAACRTLDLTDEAGLGVALAVQLANAPYPLPAGHEEFLVLRMGTMRAVQLAGHGRWSGAFVDGEMRSGLGLATAEKQVTLERAA